MIHSQFARGSGSWWIYFLKRSCWQWQTTLLALQTVKWTAWLQAADGFRLSADGICIVSVLSVLTFRGDLERGRGVGYPHRSTNLQITGTVTGGKYERRTRVPLLVFECHYWLVTACIRRTECCICLSLYWGPHVISHCLLSQGCSNFFTWGPLPRTYSYLFIQVCLPRSWHIYVQAAVGLRLKGLLVVYHFPTDNLYLLITCTSLRFKA